jgi:hypothetical protein
MGRRKRRPTIEVPSSTEHLERKRLIERLADERLTYQEALYDTTTRKPRYPLDIVVPALLKAQRKAIKNGSRLKLLADELKHHKEIFEALAWGWLIPSILLLKDLVDFLA